MGQTETCDGQGFLCLLSFEALKREVAEQLQSEVQPWTGMEERREFVIGQRAAPIHSMVARLRMRTGD